ncbi:fringe-like protein [Perilla frutescens var. hirtella]|uniref:Fringe-like protein n=1 Tax=Perilla frutescens var. hirtella TaxID=608512 RepID=A0AAD4IVG2_PERFH|nr:fringe-like protein [Perilla frutescens var. hirtella]
MNHASSHRPVFGFTTLRSAATCFFVTILLLYSLYSSKFLLNKHADLNCSLEPHDVSTKENLDRSNITTSPPPPPPPSNASCDQEEMTVASPLEIKHVAFCIAASSSLWNKRKEYIKLWWRPEETRGVVWLDKKVEISEDEEKKLPEIRISGDTSKFDYTNKQGKRSALRISRVVSETLRLGMEDVRWFVMGDDDTVFVVENVVRVLSKYDHKQLYYIGSSSESHVQNIFFSYAMAYGGGGFAISYPLAKELEKMQDRCIQRYPGLYGSDDRIHACMAELGVPLTKEVGFHQYDVYGNLLGLMAAHPVAPLVSLHHLDVVDPIFPGLKRVEGLSRLFESIQQDSASIIQQSFCYDKDKYWSISVAWGYVVQVIRGVISPREMEMPTRTFFNWYKRADYTAYAFNTRPVARHPCQKPFLFYLTSVNYDRKRRQIVGVYSRHKEPAPYCRWKTHSPDKLNTVIVLKRSDGARWQRSPRRDCCRVLPSRRDSVMYLWVGNCRSGEITEL